MADNVTIPLTGSGDTTAIVATDEVGGAQHQYVKLEFGADGTATKVSSSDPLPVTFDLGASAAHQVTGNASLSSIDGKLPALVSSRVPVDGSGVTQPVSGTVTANPGASASANNAGAAVSVGTSTTTALASYASRKAATIYASPANTQIVYVKLGATATSSNFPLNPGDSLPLNQGGSVYTGVVDAIAASGTQSLSVVEW